MCVAYTIVQARVIVSVARKERKRLRARTSRSTVTSSRSKIDHGRRSPMVSWTRRRSPVVDYCVSGGRDVIVG